MDIVGNKPSLMREQINLMDVTEEFSSTVLANHRHYSKVLKQWAKSCGTLMFLLLVGNTGA